MSLIQRNRLNNGLLVLTEEMKSANVVALQIWINVGSADETDDIAGIAHLHEHMLFKGTPGRGVGEIARVVESAGGEINAWTSFDQTVYHVVMASDETHTGLDILSDAVRRASFDNDELQREIEVVVEEIRRDRDNPSRRVSHALFGLVFQRHPYRRPILGYEETVRSLSRQRILDFFNEHYRPDNAVLVATGDFNTKDLLKQVEKYFGDWQPKPSVKRQERQPEPDRTSLQIKILREPVKEARLLCAWRVPGLCHEDIAAIDALSVILGHGDASRLYLEARRRKQLVNDVYAYAYTPRDPGLFAAGAGLQADNIKPALRAILEQVYRCREGLVTHEELERARVVTLSDAAYQRETVQGQARKRAFFEVVAGDYTFEDRYLDKLKSLTAADLRDVACRYFTESPAIVIQVPETSPELKEAEIKEVVERAVESAAKRRHRSAKPGPLDFARVELDNGALVLVREEPDSPVVAMRAVAWGGQRFETKANQGLSNIFTSLWGHSTEELSAEALARRVTHLGGALGAFGGRNSIGMRAEFIRERGEEGLELFCDAVLRSRFEATELERERQVIIQRIRNRDDNPAGVAFDEFGKALYPNHPYGLRLSGTEEVVSTFTLQDLNAHRRRFVAADKLIVSVVGNISANYVVDYLSEQLAWGHSEPLATPPKADEPPKKPVSVRHRLAKEQAHVIVGSMGARVYDRERYVLDVLTCILSGQSGRLFLDLRDKQSLAYSISSSSVDGIDPGYVMIHMGTAPEKVEQGLVGIYQHLDRLRQDLATDEELKRAHRYLVGAHAIDLQRCGARAMVTALSERFGLGYEAYTHYDDHIRSVTAEDVRRAAQHFLAPERLVEVVVGPVA